MTLINTIEKVRLAQKEYSKFTQEQVDEIFREASLAANNARIKLAKMAVEETGMGIAKQLRLRDIGGIIIIDYIDMNEETSREEIIELLKENLKNDRAKTQVMEFTKLSLLEITRKHMFSEE